MKRFSRFLTTIAVFVFAFAFSCIPSFAAETVEFYPEFANPKWNYYIDSIQPYSDGITLQNGSSADSVFSDQYVYTTFRGIIESYSTASMLGGYSYCGTLGIKFSAIFPYATATLDNGANVGTTTSKPNSVTYGQVDSVELIIDGTSYSPFLTKTALNEGTFYYTVKDLYASADNRVIVRLHVSGYSVFDLGRANTHHALERVFVKCEPHVYSVGSSYKLRGTTSGFKDNLSDFDNSMNEGSQKEDALSNKAIGDVNSFEFKDIKDDSSILSSLTFYSSVINLAYGSLGGSIQTLIAISFGVLIVIFILRIRRDSS